MISPRLAIELVVVKSPRARQTSGCPLHRLGHPAAPLLCTRLLLVCYPSAAMEVEKLQPSHEVEPVKPVPGDSCPVESNVDNAYEFMKHHAAGPVTPEDNKRILRKIDTHLLPLVRIKASH